MNKKVRNLTIGTLIISILTCSSYKVIKSINGKKSALKVLNRHELEIFHEENIVAHRGFSGLYPDNSYLGIMKALESSCVDMIEIDVRLTEDKQLVLVHDSFVGVEDVVISLDDLTLEGIDYDLIIKNFPSYSLSDLLYDDTIFLLERFVEKQKSNNYLLKLSTLLKYYTFLKPLIIDVKTDDIDLNLMNLLHDLLISYKDNIYIQSDYFPFLEVMLERYPEFRYLYIINSKNDIKNQDSRFFGYTVKYSLLDDISILDDKTYFIYTVNSNKKYFNLLNNKNYNSNMYIITDNPDYICALSEDKKIRK